MAGAITQRETGDVPGFPQSRKGPDERQACHQSRFLPPLSGSKWAIQILRIVWVVRGDILDPRRAPVPSLAHGQVLHPATMGTLMSQAVPVRVVGRATQPIEKAEAVTPPLLFHGGETDRYPNVYTRTFRQ